MPSAPQSKIAGLGIVSASPRLKVRGSARREGSPYIDGWLSPQLTWEREDRATIFSSSEDALKALAKIGLQLGCFTKDGIKYSIRLL